MRVKDFTKYSFYTYGSQITFLLITFCHFIHAPLMALSLLDLVITSDIRKSQHSFTLFSYQQGQELSLWHLHDNQTLPAHTAINTVDLSQK